MINGRSMPDTLAPNNASWLPNQPYGALVHIKPYDAATNPLPADDPLPQRRDASTTRSTRTAATSGSSTRTASRCRGRPAQDLSYLKYDIDVSPGRRSTH